MGKGSQKRSIRSSGVLFVRLNRWIGWVLEIFRILIMLFLLNRFGVYCITKILYFIRFLVKNIFQMAAFFRFQFI